MERETVNILLVDDLLSNLLALEAIIEQDHYRLHRAMSGEEALKLLLKYDFAVILLDVQMPGMDGFETAKIIKAREKTREIPIIFITANQMKAEHMFAGYSVGAVDYILKPLDPFILKAKVDVFVQLYEMKRKLMRQADMLSRRNEELHQAYMELRNSEAMARVISDASIDSMVVLDEDGTVLRANPAVERMFQYAEKELLGRPIGSLFEADNRRQVEALIRKLARDRADSTTEQLADVTGLRKDGTVFPLELQLGMRHVPDRNRHILACIMRDMTKSRQDRETIRRMAYSDWLTNLPNRRSFQDRIHEVCAAHRRNNQPFALLYVDLDRFKHVNDTLGQAIGDQLLVRVAERLSSCLREQDFLARIGGDEFQIIMPNTGRETALEYAEQIMEALSKPVELDHFELYVTTSIGISVFPFDGEDAQTILKHADAALYMAKEQGKNQYRIFHSGMNMITYRSFILQNDLHRALDRGELALVYQPRIDLRSGEVTSAEALLRWNHPQWGTILPPEFIPLAEESGMISAIGEWMIREVCRQTAGRERSGLSPIRIAVSFSAHQFMERNLAGKIRQILQEHDVPPSLLEIAVAELSIARDEEHIARTLWQFRQSGMAISLDEFGTGNCSIRYLWKYPFDSLIIGKSFVQSVPGSADNLSLLKAIMDLAHSRNISVVAEGIETEEQLAVLRELGCEEFQGYLFCPPLAPEEFADFLLKCKDDDMLLVRHKAPSFSFSLVQPFASPNSHALQAALHQTREAYSISRREFEVFELMIAGYSNREISQKLYISEHTVKNHITRIFQKLNVADRIQAMAKVYQACITEAAAAQQQNPNRGGPVE
jgi:diguanylate cyclase (GGDEF)-like protein/PAS domain S-box-containing protein